MSGFSSPAYNNPTLAASRIINPIYNPGPQFPAVYPTSQVPDTTHYVDYRTVFPPWIMPKIQPQIGINPGFINPMPLPTTSPTQNQFNWGNPNPVQISIPKVNMPVLQPIAPTTTKTTTATKAK